MEYYIMANDNSNDDNVTSKKGHLALFRTGDEWEEMEFEEPEFVIDHILPIGTGLVFGKPKLGKSYLCLSWAKQLIEQDELVLYYSLEDPDWRMRHRLRETGIQKLSNRNNLYSMAGVSCGFDEQNDVFARNLAELVKEKKPRLVIIDTMTKVKNIGREEYAKVVKWCGMFSPIAHDNKCAIIFVHHDNKQESGNPFMDAHGSIGYAGSMDTLISVKSAGSNTMDIMLNVAGKDITLNRPIRLTCDEKNFAFIMDDNALMHDLGSTQRAVLTGVRLMCDDSFRPDIQQNYDLMDMCEYRGKICQAEILNILNCITREYKEEIGGVEYSNDSDRTQLGLPLKKSDYTKQEISRACGKLLNKGYLVLCSSEEDNRSKYYRHNPYAVHLSLNDKAEF
jgi:KaiC/GvpD/RAD55 family RecA-like ATPase